MPPCKRCFGVSAMPGPSSSCVHCAKPDELREAVGECLREMASLQGAIEQLTGSLEEAGKALAGKLDDSIRARQADQPWTVPYAPETLRANDIAPHTLATHCALHAAKTVGKIAAVFESLDHTGKPPTEGQLVDLRAMSADLFTEALRFANLYRFDLADAHRERVKEKNGTTSKIPALDQMEIEQVAARLEIVGKIHETSTGHCGAYTTKRLNIQSTERGGIETSVAATLIELVNIDVPRLLAMARKEKVT